MAKKICHINSSSAEEIARAAKIGNKNAERIVGYRNEHGPFHSLDDLDDIPGFGQKMVEMCKQECDLE